VLVEATGGRWPLAGEARAQGMQVIACPGPERTPTGGCPALEGRPCPLASHADVIVFALQPSDPRVQDLLLAHPRVHGDVPLVVAPPGACTPAAEVIGLVSSVAARHHEDSGGP
jgi:hypothetical protein